MKRLFVLCLALLLLLSTACGKDREQNTDTPVPLDGMMDKAYTETYYPLPGGYTLKDVARLGDRLLLLGTVTEWDNKAGWIVTTDSALALMDYSVSDTGRITLSEAQVLPNNEDGNPVLWITAGEDGYFYALAIAGEEAEASQAANYTILRYNEDGSQADSMSVSLPVADWTTNDMLVTEDGTIVVNSASAVFILRWQAGETAVWETGDWETGYWEYPSMASTGGGILLSSYNGVYRLDTKTGEPRPAETAHQDDERSYICDYECQGLEGEYLSLVKNDGFYEYNAKTNSWDLLLSVSRASCYGNACRLSDDDFIVCANGTEALILTGAERLPYEEDARSVVKVAVLTSYSDLLSYIFDAYEDDPLYDYQVTVYDCDEDISSRGRKVTTESAAQAVDRLRVEMVAGNVPDLLLCTEQYINTDNTMFEDLYPYIDADEELSRDSFLPNLLDALSCNGELHQLWTRVQVATVVARASDVDSGYGLTVSDYRRMVEENPTYQGAFMSTTTREQLLYRAVRPVSASLFVDRENAEAHFDDPAFAELLAWCLDMPEESHGANGDFLWEESNALLSGYAISGFDYKENTFIQSEWGVGTDSLVPVGYPDGGEGYSYYYSMLSYSIPAGSRNKEGAWAFIRSQLSMDKQLETYAQDFTTYGFGGLPVIYGAYERGADSAVENGMLTPEGKALYAEILDRTKYARTYTDNELRDLIYDFGLAYLAGDRSLEETVAQLQSRAKIYAAERYG